MLGNLSSLTILGDKPTFNMFSKIKLGVKPTERIKAYSRKLRSAIQLQRFFRRGDLQRSYVIPSCDYPVETFLRIPSEPSQPVIVPRERDP